MKRVLSAVDLICLVRELTGLRNAIVQKIYQTGDEILFHLYHEHERKVLRVVVGKLIHLTSYVKENPSVPPNFCMYLRKYLKGSRIAEISQPNYERVIKIVFRKGDSTFNLFFELFGTGNAVVTTEDDVIKQPLFFKRFSSRQIRPGVVYTLPPSSFDLSDLDVVSFKRVIKSSDKDIVRALAVDIGLGGTYAEEVCINAGVDKSLNPSQISDDMMDVLFNVLLELINRAKHSVIDARVIMSGSEIVDVTPFELKYFAGKKFKTFDSFNEALDFFYARSENLSASQEKEKLVNERKKKILEQLKQREDYVNQLKQQSALLKEKAMELKGNLYTAERVLKSLLDAHRAGYSWEEIREMINKERARGSAEALLIREFAPDENRIVLDLAGGIELNLNSDVREVMNNLFEKAKKLESKIEGAEAEVERVRKKLAEAGNVEVKANIPKKINSTGKEWFERFKWFRTSEGFLAISGRSAQQNEELMRKYLMPDDLVFHADIHGSPFTILHKGRKAGEQSIIEAAQFTAAHSSAWKKGIAVDVYSVLPYQVSKEAPSGEYIATGGFMIKGKKTYYKSIKPELCIGVNVIGELSYKLVSGPKSAVKIKCGHFVTIEPGSNPQNEIIREIINFFKSKGYKFDFETIKAVLPDGECRITGAI